MGIFEGCETRAKTWELEERVCPECGELIECYTMKGRIVEDAECTCGYVLKAQEPVLRAVRDAEE